MKHDYKVMALWHQGPCDSLLRSCLCVPPSRNPRQSRTKKSDFCQKVAKDEVCRVNNYYGLTILLERRIRLFVSGFTGLR